MAQAATVTLYRGQHQMTGPEITGAKQGGRFQKGRSGNPAGKPKGARHRATLAAEALLDGEAEALTRKAVELALAGDGIALRAVTKMAAREERVDAMFPDLGLAGFGP